VSKVFHSIAIVIVFLFFLPHSGSTEVKKMNVAVLEFEVKGDIGIKDAGAIVAEWMINALFESQEYDLRERVLLRKILKEQDLGMTGVIDKKTASRIGEIYGVRGIITGSVIKWGNLTYVTGRLIDTENGAILNASEVKTNDVNDIRNQVDELAMIIIGKRSGEKDLTDSEREIEVNVNFALERFHKDVMGASEVTTVAKGLLVLPNVFKAGFIVGGEHGEGALRIGSETIDYYKITSASVGLTLGAQKKDVIIAFMTDEALLQFRDKPGWKVGMDGNIVLMGKDNSKSIDEDIMENPIIAFICNVKGLMADISLKGYKFTKLNKSK
jgi:lipid-binding SYLF domain-containing protein